MHICRAAGDTTTVEASFFNNKNTNWTSVFFFAIDRLTTIILSKTGDAIFTFDLICKMFITFKQNLPKSELPYKH